MKLIRTMLTALAAAGLGLLVASSASAYDATATTWLNVRDGPGPTNDVVDTLHPDEDVYVEECRTNGWCRIDHTGPDGWVNSSYLAPTSGPGGAPVGPDCRFQLTIGPDGPSLTITCGEADASGSADPGGGIPGGGGAPGGGPDEVCFYDNADYTGESFCRAVGVYNNLGVANDRITSVEVKGEARVRLCQNPGMRPYCRDVTASERELGTYLDDNVSSMRVYTGSLPPLKQACFFEFGGYSGDYFCMRAGTINTLPVEANDEISSLVLFAGAEATLCVNTHLDGFCRTVTANTPALGVLINDRASSVYVE